MNRIGVFGGTFNPPHLGHLLIAESVREALELECVLWVPAADQPLKDDRETIPVEHRVEMVRLSIADNQAFNLSLIDADRPGPHFSVDTLDILLSETPQAQFTLIIGSDSLRDLPLWHEPGRLVDKATLAVADRPGITYDLQDLDQHIPGLQQAVKLIDVPRIDLSATEIRQRCATHRSIRYLVVPAVAAYIDAHHLYRTSTE